MRSHNSPPLLRRAQPVAAAPASHLAAPTSRATSILEFPDNGSEQMGRGGAWLARASDPLATMYNPAGLAGQATRLTLQSNFSTQNFCYTRQLATNDPTLEPLAGANGQFPQVCGSSPLGVDPQLGFTYRVNDRIGIGILPLVAPSAAGSNTTWPTFVADSRGVLQPAPQRYLLLSSNLVLVTPTIAAGFEVARGLRLGASFQGGIASFDFKNASAGTNGGAIMGQPPDPKNERPHRGPFRPPDLHSGVHPGGDLEPARQLRSRGLVQVQRAGQHVGRRQDDGGRLLGRRRSGEHATPLSTSATSPRRR